MDQRTNMFLIFLAFGAASVAAGWMLRHRRPTAEAWSRPIHLFSLIALWSPIAMVSYWRLPLDGDDGTQLLILTLVQPVLMVAAALVMAGVMRIMKRPPEQAGVMIVAAGLSNHGFTLGAYLCYALLTPGELALSYGIAYVMSMSLFNVLIFYPIARHYGSEKTGSVVGLVARSLFDIRAAPLYFSVAGVLLNLAGVTLPTQLDDWHVMDALFFAGAGTAYAAIGLRLHLGPSVAQWKLHAVLAAVQFGWHPIATVALLTGLTAAGLHIADLPYEVMTVEAFMPTAINIVILANLFHLDARLASGVWLWNSALFAAVVLPIVMVVF